MSNGDPACGRVLVMLHSPWPSLEPYAPITVPSVVGATARRLGDKPALLTPDGVSCTYAELWRAFEGVAGALGRWDVGRGDVVAIYAANSREYVVALQGALLAGATVTTLNPLYRAREVERQLADTGAKVVFAQDASIPVVLEAGARLPGLVRVAALESVWDLAHEPPRHDDSPPDGNVAATDIAVLPYSSGTTGLPKGVMLSHQNLTSSIRQLIALGMASEDEVLLDFLPFYHIYGMMVLNAGLALGVTQVILPHFAPDAVFDLIGRHHITSLYAVPPALLALAHGQAASKADLSSLRVVVSGAAPLADQVQRDASATLGCTVIEAYGMTEASAITNANPLSAPRRGTVGPPVADTIEKVVSLDSDAELPAGEAGELLVRGPQVMRGYWNQPAATAEALTPDGWLRTGDIASADQDGYVRIHDRKKEMIKYKGYQVMPAELEAVLLEHPDVLDAAVIPMPDPVAGEVPKAFVVLRGPGVDLQFVVEFVRERVAPYKRIRHIECLDAIPRALSGKILRRQLIEQERERVRAEQGRVADAEEQHQE
jgi:acyl-CoA synthetase (AMP-forming)/AMP-acid ligase II